VNGNLPPGEARIVALTRVDARIIPFDWPFRRDNAALIADNWARMSAEKPAMFNGQVLLQCNSTIKDGVMRAGYFQTDYASFLGWRFNGMPQYPGSLVRNGFAMAALKSRDGAWLMGVMAAHTVNAGQIYFAAGTPDLDDVREDGTVDLAGSLLRELTEETGLRADEVVPADAWTAVLTDGRVAFMREVVIDLAADAARSLILSRLKDLHEEELSDIAIARSARDIDDTRMPLFMQAFLRHAFRA
jgi:8-oxo-dGTP pyrophosphatase MutT (NUDIX family)